MQNYVSCSVVSKVLFQKSFYVKEKSIFAICGINNELHGKMNNEINNK